MSENNILYEVAEIMSNKHAMKNDMAEIMKTINTMVQEKYVERINHAIHTHQTAVQKAPPKEIQLIQTLKLFMPQDNHHKMDKMVDMMLLMNTFQNIRTEFSNINKVPSVAADSDSIHEDGVYDVDSACLYEKKNDRNLAPIFLLMSLMR